MNNICAKYCELIKKEFSNEVKSIVIYGSNIYNASASDLDVCLIMNKCDNALKEKIINKTIEFHKKYKLKVDTEIPYENKLIYTESEIEDTLKNPPFYVNNKVIIKDIVKTDEFLASNYMKQRLLLNILTTDHLTIGKETVIYENKAFKIMLDVIKKYFNLKNPSEFEILECFYENKFTGAEGEMYLGYKKNYKEKEQYLLSKIREYMHD